MQIPKIIEAGNNYIIIAINGVGTFLYSYGTPIIATTPDGLKKLFDGYKVTNTTAKHITRFCECCKIERPTAVEFNKMETLPKL